MWWWREAILLVQWMRVLLLFLEKAGLGFAYLINSWSESAIQSIAEAGWFPAILAG